MKGLLNIMTDQKIEILTDVQHVLLRPGMYIGSTRKETQNFWIVNEDGKLEKQEVAYIPGLFKLFSEILDNAIDEHVRGHGNRIDVTVNYEDGTYEIRDYARGIPLEKHKEAKVPTPQVVFTQLRAGSNFNDEDRKTVGMNGVGASLATVFAEKLIVKVWRRSKLYQQAFTNNMGTIGKPDVGRNTKKDSGTYVMFKPDMKIFTDHIPIELIRKRCLEITVAFPGLEVHLFEVADGNTKKTVYSTKNFEDFVKRFDTEYHLIENKKMGMKLAVCHNNATEAFEQYSNMNGADTFRGGTHVDYFKAKVAENLREKVKKEFKLEATNADVAKNLLVVLFQQWNAPQFDGQTKDKFVNDKKEVAEHYDSLFTPRKVTSIVSNLPTIKQAVVDMVSIKNDRKEMAELRRAHRKISKKKVPKLIEASGKDRMKCTLYITEGDSAISNLATVRDSKTMAGIPLRGKVLNVDGMSPKKIVENKEIQALLNSIGLAIGEPASVRNLNYGRIVIATDQDMDGYCIRCLLVNFLYRFWSELFDQGRVYILETPLYEVIEKNKTTHYFYNKEEFEEFMKGRKSGAYEISYFKGLGSCGKEAWDYMINKKPNIVRITNHDKAKKSLKLVFGDDSDARKEWLS